VGIFDFVSRQHKGELELPISSRGTLRAWAISPEPRWLAVSGTSRSAVWDLPASKRLYYTRRFRGGYFDGDQALLADFPKQDPQLRTIARADLPHENMVPALPIDEKIVAQQNGRFLLLRKPAGKQNSLIRNVTLEIEDVRDGNVLWSRTLEPLSSAYIKTGIWRSRGAWNRRRQRMKSKPAVHCNRGSPRCKTIKGRSSAEVVEATSRKLARTVAHRHGQGFFPHDTLFGKGELGTCGRQRKSNAVLFTVDGRAKGDSFWELLDAFHRCRNPVRSTSTT